MIDTTFSKVVRVETVECSIRCITEIAFLIGIAKYALFNKCMIGLVSLIHIEITCKDCRKIGSQFLHLLLDKESTFNPRFLADMVHMQIEEQELESGIFALKVSPAANAG